MAESIASVILRARDEISGPAGEAGEAVRDLANEADEAEAAVASLDRAADRAAESSEALGDAAGNVGGNAAKAAGAVGLLSPAAGEAAMVVADLADLVEVLSTAAGACGISLGGLAVAMAPVAAAAAALGAVYVVLNAQLEEAEQKAAAAAAAATALAAANDGWKETVRAINEEWGVANGELDEYSVGAQRQIEQLRAQRAATEELLAAEVRRIETAQGGWSDNEAEREQLAAARERLSAYQQQTEELATKVELLAEKRRVEAEQTEAAAVAAEELAQDQAAAAASEAAAAKAAADAAAAEAARLAGIREQIAMYQDMWIPTVDHAAEVAATLRGVLDELVPPAALSVTERLALAEADLALAFSRGAIDAAAYQARLEELAATKAAIAAEDERTQSSGAVSSAASAVEMAAGGPDAVMSGVAAAGPWGALIAAIVELVQNFADVGNQFNDFTISFNESLGNLPNTIADNLDTWLTTGTEATIGVAEALLSGLADRLPEILQTVVGFLPELAAGFIQALILDIPLAAAKFVLVLSDPTTWLKVAVALVEGIVDALSEMFAAFKKVDEDVQNAKPGEAIASWWEGLGATAEGAGAGDSGEPGWFAKGGFFDDLFSGRDVPAYDVGSDYIHKTHIGILHEGERVYTAARERASAGGRSGGAPTIILGHGMLIGTVEELSRRVGATTDDYTTTWAS